MRNLSANLKWLTFSALLLFATSCSVHKKMANPTKECKEWLDDNPEKAKHIRFERQTDEENYAYEGRYNFITKKAIVVESVNEDLNSDIVERMEFVLNLKKNFEIIKKVLHLCSGDQLKKLMAINDHASVLFETYRIADINSIDPRERFVGYCGADSLGQSILSIKEILEKGNEGPLFKKSQDLYSELVIFYSPGCMFNDVLNEVASDYDRVPVGSAYSDRKNHGRFVCLTAVYRIARIFVKKDVRNQKINQAIVDIYTFEINGEKVIFLQEEFSKDFLLYMTALVKSKPQDR